jgi:hypothetical protein
MNILFSTQANKLDLFYHLSKKLEELSAIENIGFYCADSRFFNLFSCGYPEINTNKYMLLKEWEIAKKAKHTTLNMNILEKYETKIGKPYLWNAIIADRRLYYGSKYAYSQDYKSRYTYDEMLLILQVALTEIEELFDKIKPDMVVSFICTTLGDYIIYLFAKHREIPILNLRPTRINNFLYAGEHIFEPSGFLKNLYEGFMKTGVDETKLLEESQQYIKQAYEHTTMYEGVIKSSINPPNIKRKEKTVFLIEVYSKLKIMFRDSYKYYYGELKHDPHVSGVVEPIVYQKIFKPIKAKLMHFRFRNEYVTESDLDKLNYAFFPLHTEPEVTLSVYSKPYINQIEAIRLISHNLPVGMYLLVKEHPWSVGKRPNSFFEKLLDIPNVRLVSPINTSRDLIKNASLITVISGSIALEAMFLKKPAIVLGLTPFNFLPKTMLRYNEDPTKLGDEIKEILMNYKYDDKALECYVAAIIKSSVRVDFYSVLSKRQESINERGLDVNSSNFDIERGLQMSRLASYLMKIYNIRKTFDEK